ncbi:hypothetical protein GCM10025768_21770 [Microbacterium pseudoresistens]
MIAEYSAEARMARGSVDIAFAESESLRTVFPAVRAALHEGRISLAHAREVLREGEVVRDAVREGVAAAESVGLYEAAALAVAEQESPSRTRARARQIATALVPDAVHERHAEAAAERTVTVRSLDDGLALLTAVLPEYAAIAIRDRLSEMARQIAHTDSADDPGPGPDAFLEAGEPIEEAGEPIEDVVAPRTLDQIRADLLTDLLLAAVPSAALGNGLGSIQGRVQVTVAATTLAGLDDRMAELDGHGPLHPDIARAIAGMDTGWTRLFIDQQGTITHTDTYSPNAAMKRHLRARDQHCRFPGCRMPAARCEIDHNHDHAKGGPTSLDNLSHFCHGHHVLKHPDIPPPARWTAGRLPDGSIRWISPHGRAYADPAPRRVMFV